mmetsp:Transcript_14950/g.23814  ORF Transcript_14950/g.23814 Transcript_14950/m.23814 type:complete len:251 (-) Transcript_14950:299-1051(-)
MRLGRDAIFRGPRAVGGWGLGQRCGLVAILGENTNVARLHATFANVIVIKRLAVDGSARSTPAQASLGVLELEARGCLGARAAHVVLDSKRLAHSVGRVAPSPGPRARRIRTTAATKYSTYSITNSSTDTTSTTLSTAAGTRTESFTNCSTHCIANGSNDTAKTTVSAGLTTSSATACGACRSLAPRSSLRTRIAVYARGTCSSWRTWRTWRTIMPIGAHFSSMPFGTRVAGNTIMPRRAEVALFTASTC